jgi:ribose transport system ATP-binding protein
MTDYILQMKGIKKAFNRMYALKGVDFSLKKGEIHALIGENGAGKTTLMNILGGVLQNDEGEILINGGTAVIPSPAASKKLGVGFIHQELNLVNDLKVYENLFLGSELKTRAGFVDVRRMCEKTAGILKILNVDIDPKETVINLNASYKQIVEISRALLQEARIIIMDEPTTSLTEHEITYLFKLMRSLKEKGVSIIFISHKLKEVMTICDRYTVLRDGELASSGPVSEGKVTEEDLARFMVGKELAVKQYYEKRQLGKVILEAKNLSYGKEFNHISFDLREGEIIGFTGLAGDGRTELFECIFGCRKKYDGDILINGVKKTLNHPVKSLACGIGFAPKNRKENAIVKDFSVRQNMSLARLSNIEKGFMLNTRIEKEKCRAHIKRLNVKVHDMDLPITSLSGGNQQKVVIAKWIEAGSNIIILDNPTQGIDVGAKAEIYELISNMAKEGKSFVVLSSEVPEITRLCDRVFVMYHGSISGELERSEVSEESVMLYATGAKVRHA